MMDETSLRQIHCELNHLPNPDGSVMLMQGDTGVVVGIYGPVEGKQHAMMYTKAIVDVAYRPVKGPNKIDDRLKELFIQESCESMILSTLYPSTAININIQELEDSGGILATMINATCLALINSGLSMKHTIAAVNCMIEDSTNEIIIDPDSTQLKNAKAEFTYAFDSIKKDIVCIHTSGSFKDEELLETVDRCKQASQFIFDFYRKIVHQYATTL
ncbi:exosome complex component RRP46 [Prorops nasuta]|uniref:exosome complex component RRP46 n=1 Tax=Prorops nasuta TaxID=863751 RepID=UPI0034CF131F